MKQPLQDFFVEVFHAVSSITVVYLVWKVAKIRRWHLQFNACSSSHHLSRTSPQTEPRKKSSCLLSHSNHHPSSSILSNPPVFFLYGCMSTRRWVRPMFFALVLWLSCVLFRRGLLSSYAVDDGDPLGRAELSSGLRRWIGRGKGSCLAPSSRTRLRDDSAGPRIGGVDASHHCVFTDEVTRCFRRALKGSQQPTAWVFVFSGF